MKLTNWINNWIKENDNKVEAFEHYIVKGLEAGFTLHINYHDEDFVTESDVVWNKDTQSLVEVYIDGKVFDNDPDDFFVFGLFSMIAFNEADVHFVNAYVNVK